MHGCTFGRPVSVAALLLALTVLTGCDEPDPVIPSQAAAPASELASAFDPAACGTITGRVVWDGPVPTVAGHSGRVNLFGQTNATSPFNVANPHAPVVNPRTRGVAGVVVYLHGVEPRRSRPWDLPPVRVELRDLNAHVFQGETESIYGFVRRGESVAILSREPVFHSLHARGAAYFTVPLPDADQVMTRPLNQKGLVDLTSACGYYWLRGHLFVDDHPYYTRTDADGNFTLPQVPEGEYDVACWLPDWHEQRHERDPETCLVVRLTYRRPVELVKNLAVRRGQTSGVTFTPSLRTFGE